MLVNAFSPSLDITILLARRRLFYAIFYRFYTLIRLFNKLHSTLYKLFAKFAKVLHKIVDKYIAKKMHSYPHFYNGEI